MLNKLHFVTLLPAFFNPMLAYPTTNYPQEYNEIVYIVNDNHGKLNAKIAKVNNQLTTGGVDEEAKNLSDYKIDLQGLDNPSYSIKIEKKSFQSPKCAQIEFTFKDGYIYISKLPKSIETATNCRFNLDINNTSGKKINILLNYTYRKWCHLKPENEATRTAKRLDKFCNTNNVKNIKDLDLNSENFDIKDKIKDLSPLSGLIQIKQIDLQYNLIDNIPENIFSYLTHLETLNFWDNRIKYLDIDLFKNNFNMKKINLGSNKLSKLPKNIFQSLVNIEDINLSVNELEFLDQETFKSNVFLKSLDLGMNNLVHLQSGLFDTLEKLEKLFIFDNKIIKLDANIFKNNRKLKNLTLSSNRLSNLPQGLLAGLSELEILWLFDNKIEKINPHIFSKNRKLKILNLSNNKFNTLPVDIFSTLNEIEILNIQNNKINNINEILAANENLRKSIKYSY